jgi:hypothetical protein
VELSTSPNAIQQKFKKVEFDHKKVRHSPKPQTPTQFGDIGTFGDMGTENPTSN